MLMMVLWSANSVISEQMQLGFSPILLWWLTPESSRVDVRFNNERHLMRCAAMYICDPSMLHNPRFHECRFSEGIPTHTQTTFAIVTFVHSLVLVWR